MSKLNPEVVAKFSELQEQVWQNVTKATGAISENPITFIYDNPEPVPPEIARALTGETTLTIQFAFASTPESNQFVVIPRDAFAKIAGFVTGEEVLEPDEALIPVIRDFLEGIVQGICLACGVAKNEPMVASGLSIRYQALSLPDNFGRNDELVKTEVQFAAKDLQGSLSWFIDNTTAEYMVGWEGSAETQASEGHAFQSSNPFAPQLEEEVGGLSLLMDIPLEISVELGRVRMLVKDVVDLGTGSIVEIDKAAGDPVDVMVNGRLVARGEVVVIEDNFGVRITEILTAQERVTRLGEVA